MLHHQVKRPRLTGSDRLFFSGTALGVAAPDPDVTDTPLVEGSVYWVFARDNRLPVLVLAGDLPDGLEPEPA